MVTIRTVSGTPEGDIIRTMKITPEKEEEWKSLQEVIKEKTRKFKTLGEIKEGFMYDVIEKSKKRKKVAKKRQVVIRKASSAIKKAYEKGRAQYMAEARQMALRRKQQQRFEAERLAEQQRARYETPDAQSAGGYEQPIQQEQFIEDDYGREVRQSSFLQQAFHKLKPNPGVLNRFRNIGSLGMGRGGQRKDIINQNQIGTRHVTGMGQQVRERLMLAPRISLLGGGNPQQPIQQGLTLFQSQLNKSNHNLRW